jgi:UDP:flavonoid glycosyltransferase YjiC (YdhE family)
MVADQHLHAALVERHDLGAAAGRRGLTADRLVRALERALGSRVEDLARGAEAVAGGGAEAAVAVLEEVAGRG